MECSVMTSSVRRCTGGSWNRRHTWLPGFETRLPTYKGHCLSDRIREAMYAKACSQMHGKRSKMAAVPPCDTPLPAAPSEDFIVYDGNLRRAWTQTVVGTAIEFLNDL